MTILCRIHGESFNSCTDQEYSPLCFCQSKYRKSLMTDIFLSKISLSQCTDSYSIRQCRQARFSPSLKHITELVPNLINHNHCLNETYCLHTLQSNQRCRQCQIYFPEILTENISYVISTITNNLPSDSCFYICNHDKSCGFLCSDQRVTIKVDCNACRGRRKNVTCRCIKVKQALPCNETIFETTTPRWMQKRGFPAAGILALFVLITILLVIAMKVINYRLTMLARHRHNSIRRSAITLTTYRSQPASPAAAVSLSSTPLISAVQKQRDIVAVNTMVELMNDRSGEYAVDTHQRDEDDELSVFLLEKTPPINTKLKDLVKKVRDDINQLDRT